MQKKNSKPIFLLINFLILVFLILYFNSCSYVKDYKNIITEENSNITNENNLKTSYNLYVSTEYYSPISFLESSLDFQIPDFNDDSDYFSYIKIIASMPVKTPFWIKDTNLWIEGEEQKTINIVFERKDESLAAAKRLAENEIKGKIDVNLKYLLEKELEETLKILEINDDNFLSYLKFEINDIKLNINQYYKESYWQYIILKLNDQSFTFYRYYIYVRLLFSLYEDIRNQFILRIYKDKNQYKRIIEMIINYFKIKF